MSRQINLRSFKLTCVHFVQFKLKRDWIGSTAGVFHFDQHLIIPVTLRSDQKFAGAPALVAINSIPLIPRSISTCCNCAQSPVTATPLIQHLLSPIFSDLFAGRGDLSYLLL
jgi:hypothetical protein